MDCIPIYPNLENEDVNTYEPKEGFGCIYLCKVLERYYVGQTRRTVKYRMWQHKGGRKNNLFDNVYKAHGVDWIGILIICPIADLNFWERYYIKKLNTMVPNGWNLTAGGDTATEVSDITRCKMSQSRVGIKFSEEHRKNLSKASKERYKTAIHPMKGRPSKYKGVPRSEEVRRKISEGNKGRVTSEETRMKISNTLIEYNKTHESPTKGRVLTEEQKKHLSELNSGPNNPNYGKPRDRAIVNKIAKSRSRPIIQYSDTGEFIKEYESTRQAEIETGISNSNIAKCLKGDRPLAGGFIWRRKLTDHYPKYIDATFVEEYRQKVHENKSASCKGRVLSEETKKKIAESIKAKKNV